MATLTQVEVAQNELALTELRKKLPVSAAAASSEAPAATSPEETTARENIDKATVLNKVQVDKENYEGAFMVAKNSLEAYEKAQEEKKKVAAFATKGLGVDFIRKAFVAKYPEVEIKQQDGHDLLTFPTPKAALDFFTDQAKSKDCPPFLAQKYDGQKPADDYHYFCGVGPLLSGNKADIEKKLNEAIAKETNVDEKTKLTDGLAEFKRLTAPNSTAAFRDMAKLTSASPPAPNHMTRAPSSTVRNNASNSDRLNDDDEVENNENTSCPKPSN